jgi:predicted P-loop ATPase
MDKKIRELEMLPAQFALTPVRAKAPYLTNWQSNQTTRNEIAQHLISGKADGFGIKLGIPSGGICAIDIDGTAARAKLHEIIGKDAMPFTVEFASGKIDRSQYLFTIPPELWDTLKTKSVKFPNGEGCQEEIGFFWNGRQSVLPPSAHPETKGYFWVHSPQETEIKSIPDRLLEYWLNLIELPFKAEKTIPIQLDIPSHSLTIPIERLLSTAHRTALNGVSMGGRNSTGASLARDLIGIANLGSIECDYRGKNHTLKIEGDAEDIFYSYCDCCNPPLSKSEANRIWVSAQSTNDGQPAIRDPQMLRNCARSYLKDMLPKRGRPVGSGKPNRVNDEPISGRVSRPDSNHKDYQAIGRRSGINLSDKGIDKNGIPNSKLLKLKLDLFDLFGERLQFNEMSREIELDHQPIDLNLAKDFVSTALEYDSSTENCIIALNAIATKFKYHPVREYLESLRGKGTDLDLIANFPKHYFGNSDPLQNRLFFRKLVATVARAMKPGTKDDSLLVLQGKQGAGKSTALKALAGDDWFNDDLRSLDDKDEIAKLSRFWLLELAEVDYLFGKKEVELFKRFLSCTEDTFRPPYGRANILVKRACGLFATTNKSEFLTDPTGDRRYWVVEVREDIDIEAIRRDRDLIWATALAAYEHGHIHYLDAIEQTHHRTANTEWRDEDPWLDTILPNLRSVTHYSGSIEYVNIQEIMDKILNIPTERQDKRQRNRIAATLRGLGYENKTIRTEEGFAKVWQKETLVTHPDKDKSRAEISSHSDYYSNNLCDLSLETIEKRINNSKYSGSVTSDDSVIYGINLDETRPMSKDALHEEDESQVEKTPTNTGVQPVSHLLKDEIHEEDESRTGKKIKRDEYLEYSIEETTVNWVEIAFDRFTTAKTWADQLTLWGGKVSKPHKIARQGVKYLLNIKGLGMDALERILSADITIPPQRPSI